MSEVPPKAVSEVKDYDVDWSLRLDDVETLDTSVWTVPAGLTQPVAASIAPGATKTRLWLGAGVAGVRYFIKNVVTTSLGRTYEEALFLRVLDDSTADELQLVRLYLGDTDPTAYLTADDQILLTLDRHRNTYYAAAFLADALGARYARKPNRSIDGLSINYAQIGQQYAALAKSLRAQGAAAALDNLDGTPGAGLYVGGLSVAEKQRDLADTSLNGTAFSRGQFNNAGGTSR